MDIQNALCKTTVIYSEPHATRAQWVWSEAENSAIVATVQRLITVHIGTRRSTFIDITISKTQQDAALNPECPAGDSSSWGWTISLKTDGRMQGACVSVGVVHLALPTTDPSRRYRPPSVWSSRQQFRSKGRVSVLMSTWAKLEIIF